MKRWTCPAALVAVLLVSPLVAADSQEDPTRVLPEGKKPDDRRLGKPRTLDDTDFFLKVPGSRREWEKRRMAIRTQVLVANGLWPLLPKTELHPVIHRKIDRDDYTVEKVFFASLPGHYVSGSLFRPKGKTGRVPGVLCPHGHWPKGRFTEENDNTVQQQMKMGAEKTVEGARYPLQARCAQLARMGCVVFHYDMVGYADSTALTHREGFTDAEADLRLQSFMGLQTWNSIRALDFLLSLPEVDAKRIGVTGASGGGTQTFILCAVDDRPTVAFPAVMVSTEMQGGCICENSSHLRVGTGNIELAGLFVPRPLGMTAADDWTKNIEKRGLPELKALYRLYGAEDNVMARYFPFPHNYNQVSREVMYNWFNKHLKLGQAEPVTEKLFKPVPAKELSVYDDTHPRPADTANAERLRQYLTETSDRQLAQLRPTDKSGLQRFRSVLEPALRVMIHDSLPGADKVEVKHQEAHQREGALWSGLLLGRKGEHEQVPVVLVKGKDSSGVVVVWAHPQGKGSLWQDGKLHPAARKLLDHKAAILAVDVLGTGELKLDKGPVVDPRYCGYTFGYNRPLLANRVHDLLTAVASARQVGKAEKVYLVGFEKAGPWVLLARGLCGQEVARAAADFDGFRFEKVRKTDDEMMLPGALKYGGLPALAALGAPGELFIWNHRGTGAGGWLKGTYQAAGASAKLQSEPGAVSAEKAVEWLLR
jgi:dienelactone hydrolase